MEENIFEPRTDLSSFQTSVQTLKEELGKVIVGQEQMVELLLAVQLCLWQVIGPLLFNWVLRCHNQKRSRKGVSLSINRHLSLLHDFKQCSLCFCRRPVYFIDQHDIAEYWALLELKARFLGIEY